ncbi:TonB-dependent siderophore receptor [Pseudomonas sp. Fl4BN1]|uniref:TonB-dependent siderophore receptor n=1 Tax=Pseudomonas sp. Fl4BN1 TaxID=2697651 RepID=UPI0013786256|nr:TonB-dependent siderophore receptor [Pseudomonas sp. Fl4BN1]NBF12808.1 TonB-dependent siderophore receptor [Pseudomonas sp. Fl4BN1]
MPRRSCFELTPLCLALLLGSLPVAAQAAPGNANQAPRTFNLPAASLATTLSGIARQGGREIIYVPSLVKGLTAPEIHGELSTEQALQRALAGTGLVARVTPQGTLTLEQLPADVLNLDTTTINGRSQGSNTSQPVGYLASRSNTATKTDTAIHEVPQSISVVTREQLDTQNVQNLSEALRYTTGVNSEPFGADNRNDYIYIRGFDQSNDGLFLDGLNLLNRNYAMWRVDPYSLEQVDVIRGPSSVLFGQSSPGGLVNQVSKRPAADMRQEVKLQYGSYDRKIAAIDVGGKLDEQGQWLGRLTAQVKDGSTQIDHVDESSWFIAPSLTWNIDDDTSLTLLAQTQRERYGSVFQYLPYYGTVKSNPLGRYQDSLFAGEPDFDHFNRDQDSVGYQFEHRFDDTWSARQNFRYRHLKLDYETVYGLGYSAYPYPSKPSDYAEGFRGALTSATTLTGWALDNQVQADFNTGALEHKVLLGGDLQYTTYDIFNQGSPNGDPNAFNYFTPNYGWVPSDLQTTNEVVSKVRQLGAYVQDQMKYEHWAFTLGGRVDWARINQNNDGGSGVYAAGNPAGNSQRSDRKPTWRAGVVYLADNGLAPYYSYSESFVPTVALTSKIMQPSTGKQHEVGLKYQPPGSNSSVTLSAFDLRKQNVPTTDPNDPSGVNQIQIGEVRSRGIELEGIAGLSEELNLIANFAYTRVKVTRDTNFEGNRPFNVPEHTASLWADYSFKSGELKGLGFGAGARYVGSSFGDDANTLRVPGYTLFDAMARYDLESWRLQLNGSNLLNNSYATCQNGEFRCNYGNPRALTATVAYSW